MTSEDKELISKRDLDKILNEQKKYYKLIKLELEIFNLQNQYNKIRSENEELAKELEKYEKEINYFKTHIHNVSKEQQYYMKEYNKILSSTSWKIMAPLRMFGSVAKGVTGRRNKR